MNPTANPIVILPVNGIRKSDIVRFVVWPLTLVSPGMYLDAFKTTMAAFCETGCNLFQSMLTIR
jgi:hypothetical protein